MQPLHDQLDAAVENSVQNLIEAHWNKDAANSNRDKYAYSLDQMRIDTYSQLDGPAGIVSYFKTWDSTIGALLDKINQLPAAIHNIPSGSDLPGRAEGGPVAAGMPYKVGEHGQELFVPYTNGTIIPNHQISSYYGGGDSVSMPSSAFSGGGGYGSGGGGGGGGGNMDFSGSTFIVQPPAGSDMRNLPQDPNWWQRYMRPIAIATSQYNGKRGKPR